MNKNLGKFSSEKIVEILSFCKHGIAIYATPNMVIEAVNDAMVLFWRTHKNVVGQPLQEILPPLKNQPLISILKQVFLTGIDVKETVVPIEILINSTEKTHYFDIEYKAIKNEHGETYCILHTIEDVTEHRLNHLEIKESESRFRMMVEMSPVAMMVNKGDDLIFETLNQPMIELIGKGDRVKGKAWFDAIPELKGQLIIDRLYNTYKTGEEWNGFEEPIMMMADGILTKRYFNLIYRSLKENGKIVGLLQSAFDVTEQVKARQIIQDNLIKEQQRNEALTIINEALAKSQQGLKVSESKLDQIITSLPAPIVVLKGSNQIVTTTNEALLRFWNKTKEQVLGKPMLEIFPELKNQQFPAQWKHVFNTGEVIANREAAVVFNRHSGDKRLFYVDYYYQPLLNLNGKIEAILATVIDVTDKVEARLHVEQAEAKLRQAIDSSELGTWYLNVETSEFIPSQRLKEIIGFYPEEKMTYENAANQITEAHRDKVLYEIEQAILNGGSYDMEYPMITYRDKQLKWVRATGKLYKSTGISPANFSGTLQDITQRKLKEQEKDDFISIASHELKTPITSLKASLQLLDKIKNNPSTELLIKLIEQANRSMGKLTSLMDDLLNSARTTEGQLHLNKTTFSISEMLTMCCSHVRVSGNYELIIQGEKNLMIHADELRIDQVVVNFVNNAVKYAPESRKIFLIVEKLSGMVKVSIKDNGPGISSDKILHLFNRYYRVDHAGSQYSGLGLGLYISSEIIKRHGGQIGVDSKLGEGSCFWFTLPIL